MTAQVRADPAAGRYVIEDDGRRLGFLTARRDGDVVTLPHAEIDPAHEGRGLGTQLARETLDDLRRQGVSVVPACPFVAAFVRRHPDEYLDLLTPAWRARLGGGT